MNSRWHLIQVKQHGTVWDYTEYFGAGYDPWVTSWQLPVQRMCKLTGPVILFFLFLILMSLYPQFFGLVEELMLSFTETVQSSGSNCQHFSGGLVYKVLCWTTWPGPHLQEIIISAS